MAVNPQFKITQIAKDLGKKSKDIVDLLTQKGVEVKNTQKNLEAGEFDILFDTLTKANQIKEIENYIDGITYIPSKIKKEEPKAEAPKAEAPKAEAPKAEAPKAEAPKAEAPKAEAPKTEAPKAEAPKTEAPAAPARPQQPQTQRPAAPQQGGNDRFGNRPPLPFGIYYARNVSVPFANSASVHVS